MVDDKSVSPSIFRFNSFNEHLNNIHQLFIDQAIVYLYNQITTFLDLINQMECTDQHKNNILQLQEFLDKKSHNVHISQKFSLLKNITQLSNTEFHDGLCRKYFTQLQSSITALMNYMNQTEFKDPLPYLNLDQIDTKLAYNQLIDPISNQKRLDILFAIGNDKKRFKDLEQALDLQAGHLIYHLNPLKEGKYVKQDNKKNYYLSNRGKLILVTIKRMYDEFITK